MRKLRDDKTSRDTCSAYSPGSAYRSGAYCLLTPFIAIPAAVSVAREYADYHIPIRLAKNSEFWRGMRETYLSISAWVDESIAYNPEEGLESVINEGKLRWWHPIFHSFAQIYDVAIGYFLTPFIVPFSWQLSAVHDTLYNVVDPLLPEGEIRDSAYRWTEFFRGTKLAFNCPTPVEFRNAYNKGCAAWYGSGIHYVDNKEPPKNIRQIVDDGGVLAIPKGCLKSIKHIFKEHKSRRKKPKPWQRLKNSYSYVYQKIVTPRR